MPVLHDGAGEVVPFLDKPIQHVSFQRFRLGEIEAEAETLPMITDDQVIAVFGESADETLAPLLNRTFDHLWAIGDFVAALQTAREPWAETYGEKTADDLAVGTAAALLSSAIAMTAKGDEERRAVLAKDAAGSVEAYSRDLLVAGEIDLLGRNRAKDQDPSDVSGSGQALTQ